MKAVNLIPSEQRSAGKSSPAGAARTAPETPATGAYVILGALLFAVAAMALMVLTNNDIKKSKADLAQVQADTTAIEGQASTLQSFADFKQLSSSRVATVKGLADARFQWAATLDDVSRALPKNVFISGFDGSTAGGSSGGSETQGAIQAPSIALNGCTTDQASVARLMSSLRDVRGVTRVSLTKSESADAADAAAAPAPLTPTDGDTSSIISQPCPKGAPPAFELVIFFERAALGTAATPNGGVAAAGPTGPAGAPTGSSGATTPASTSTTTTP